MPGSAVRVYKSILSYSWHSGVLAALMPSLPAHLAARHKLSFPSPMKPGGWYLLRDPSAPSCQLWVSTLYLQEHRALPLVFPSMSLSLFNLYSSP